MKDDLTDLVCIVDRSGSMDAIRDDAIGGFNAFLEAQKAEPGTARLTYAQFDDRYDLVHDAVPLGSVPPLTRETFVPRGSTALYDAICRTMDRVGQRLAATPEAERPGHVVVVIVTDGHENASRRHTHADVQRPIAHQRDVYGWQFVFLAAHQDAMAGAVHLGMDAEDGVAFEVDAPLGVASSYVAMSVATSARRSRPRA